MQVLGITGHQNLPKQGIAYITGEIERALHQYGMDFVGVSSLAVGADQLFAKAVIQVGGQLHVVIPCRHYESTFIDQAALDTFATLLNEAKRVETLDFEQPSEDAFLSAGQRVVELSDSVFAIWDGKAAKGRGGTADIVQFAKDLGKELVVIWPSGMSR